MRAVMGLYASPHPMTPLFVFEIHCILLMDAWVIVVLQHATKLQPRPAVSCDHPKPTPTLSSVVSQYQSPKG
jgi:hypothetical protein